jgi:hypothetical protein
MEGLRVLEIILLVVLGKNIAARARAKNRNPTGYVLVLVFGWFILGFGGGMVTGIVGMAVWGNEDAWLGYFLPGYLLGVASAIGPAYCLIGMTSPLRRRRRDDEYDDYDDDYDRPRSRRRYDEDEDDDEEDEDRPRRSRRPRRDDEGDFDDIPRRRRRRRVDD